MRRPKPSGRTPSGPFEASHFHAALKLGGWRKEKGGHHTHYTHPDRGGRKVSIDEKWTGVKTGHDTFKGVLAQSGYKKRELLQLLDGRPLD